MRVCAVQDLRDRNDELSLEVELLKNQRGSDRSCRREQEAAAPCWAEHQQECDSGRNSGVISQSESSSRDEGRNGLSYVSNQRKINPPYDVTEGMMPEAHTKNLTSISEKSLQ